jgi:hypothetical protein
MSVSRLPAKVIKAFQSAQPRPRTHVHSSSGRAERKTEQLAGVDTVTRVEVPEQPDVYLFDVGRPARGRLLVVWRQRDSFNGEAEPSVPFAWPWPATSATAVDALGQRQPIELCEGGVRLHVSPTPVFVAA